MKILKAKPIHFKKANAYLGAFIICLLVIIQIGITNSDGFQLVISNAILIVSTYFLWAFLIEYLNGVLPSLNKKDYTIKIVFEVVFSVFILIIFHLIITNILYYTFIAIVSNQTFFEAILSFKPFVLKSILSRFFDILIIVFLLKVYETFYLVQQQKLKVVQLEKELHTTQLTVIRSQLNPHFLFNSLHTLNTLIGFDNDKAKVILIKITNLLRKILTLENVPLITFEEELEYFKDYLEIEQERFFDRLKIDVKVDEDTKHIKVPTLILQPLIENAFKHGVSLVEKNAKVELTASIVDNLLHIKLINSVPKHQQNLINNSTKVGLKNLNEKLKTVFGSDFHFSTNKENHVFIAYLKLKPL